MEVLGAEACAVIHCSGYPSVYAVIRCSGYPSVYAVIRYSGNPMLQMAN